MFNVLRGLATSALVLLPCFWQRRIQAGDLSSHAYNAWLVNLHLADPIPGLVVVPQLHNVLFDLLLSTLTLHVEPDVAQKLAVSTAVLVFFWGAVCFVRAASGGCPWHVKLMLGMLAYGYVFHQGFFNYFLSLGLSLWALGLAWRETRRGLLAAIALLPFAALSHLLPVVATMALFTYAILERRLRRWSCLWMMLSAIAALAIVRLALSLSYHTASKSPISVLLIGADQLFLYGPFYQILAAFVAAIWIVELAPLLRALPELGSDGRRLLSLVVLCLAATVLLPDRIDTPHYGHGLVYITDRLSLLTAVIICALLATARAGKLLKGLAPAVAVVFAGMVYWDAWRLNTLEDQVSQAVARVPPGSRVVLHLERRETRIAWGAHVLDRACIGHCFSYANYEPSTRRFRLRASGDGPAVLAEFSDVSQVENGGNYAVRARDLPLWLIYQRDASHVGALRLNEGDVLADVALRSRRSSGP